MTPAATAFRCVVDASVVVRLLVPSPESKNVAKIASDMAHPDSAFHVPDLLYIEVANALWRLARFDRYSARDAEVSLAGLNQLTLHPHPLADSAPDAFRFAIQLGITAYDTCYVTLAIRLQLPFITADGKLASQLTQSACDVRLLQNY